MLHMRRRAKLKADNMFGFDFDKTVDRRLIKHFIESLDIVWSVYNAILQITRT